MHHRGRHIHLHGQTNAGTRHPRAPCTFSTSGRTTRCSCALRVRRYEADIAITTPPARASREARKLKEGATCGNTQHTRRVSLLVLSRSWDPPWGSQMTPRPGDRVTRVRTCPQGWCRESGARAEKEWRRDECISADEEGEEEAACCERTHTGRIRRITNKYGFFSFLTINLRVDGQKSLNWSNPRFGQTRHGRSDACAKRCALDRANLLPGDAPAGRRAALRATRLRAGLPAAVPSASPG